MREFEGFFDDKRKNKKLLNYYSNKYKSRSIENIFNNINNNRNSNSKNNTNNSNINGNKKLSSIKNENLKNTILNNSSITGITSLPKTRNNSPFKSIKDISFSYSFNKDNKSKKIKLPHLIIPLNFKQIEIKNHNKKKIRILSSKQLNYNNEKDNLMNEISPDVKMKNINNYNIFKLKNKIYKLRKISNYSLNENKNINSYYSNDSEYHEKLELNEEIEKKNRKIKIKDESNGKTENDDINKNKKEEENKYENNKNLIFDKKFCGINNEKRINILNAKTINIEFEDSNSKSNNYEDEKYNKIEKLFKIARKNELNLKENKKQINSFILSKGIDLSNLSNKKIIYFNINKMKKKIAEKDFISEEYIIRKRFNIKTPLIKKQKIILDRNKGFIKNIISQEKKFSEILCQSQSKLYSI